MPKGLEQVLNLTKDVGGILLLVFYAAVVLWTYKDARRRIDDPILVATAVATSMLPIVGVLVYMMLRPPEYLADVRERELEIRAMERQLGRQERCPYCKSHIESNFLSCPVCMTKLRAGCTGCDRPLDPRWAMCPFCETEVPRGTGGRDGAPKRGSTVDVRREPPARPAGSRSSKSQDSSSGSTRAGRSNQDTRTGSPKRGTSSAPKSGGSSKGASKPAPDKGSSDAPGKRSNPDRKRGDSGSGNDIRTEPFQSLKPQRFTGGDHPTMIHTGPEA